MNLLRAATVTVADAEATAARYAHWFGYRTIERGEVSPAMAASWDAPRAAGRPMTICQPASGAPAFLRFIAGDAAPEFRPLRTYGWAALELCVADVAALAAALEKSPFEIIGPPRKPGGLPSIRPMQICGPDREVVFLTEILADPPDTILPRASCAVDQLFILVLACRDMPASSAWLAQSLGLHASTEIPVTYTTLSRAFGLSADTSHQIITLSQQKHLFLELDQYPVQASERTADPGALPPGIAIGSISHPEFATLSVSWIGTPMRHAGAVYGGAPSATMRTPEGARLEVIALD